MNKITFINTFKTDLEYLPEPAINNLPIWYKNTAMEISPEDELKLLAQYGDSGNSKNTVKRCAPVQDIIGAGYILKTPFDLIVKQVNNIPYYEWPSEISAVTFHPKAQLKNHPLINTDFAAKWNNPWGVQTPKGYSAMFVHPFHHDNLPFISLSGIVDTDKYIAPVNMPFVLKDPTFEGLIPEGTPFCQVIPFKREDWSMEFGKEKLVNESKRIEWRMNRISALRYKTLYWTRKHFK